MNNNMANERQQKLEKKWDSIYKNTDKLVTWVDKVKADSRKLNNQSYDIKCRLYQIKNEAKIYRKVSTTPVIVGVFGESQAGKSYLISKFAAAADGELVTELGGQELHYTTNINPPGGGKEATALVTRFTRKYDNTPDPNFPVKLELFTEIEIARILFNIWTSDFDQEKIEYELNKDTIQKHLAKFEGLNPDKSVVNLPPEDIIALRDYIGDRKSTNKLSIRYWPMALDIVPYFDIHNRAKFFSVLWGEEEKFTNLYIKLVSALNSIKNAQKIFAGIDVFVRPAGDGFEQHNNILNVQTLNLLKNSSAESVKVLPVIDGDVQDPVFIEVGALAALTAEMVFNVSSQPAEPVIESVDLLDFPGYRSRENKELKDLRASNSGLEIELLLRGKVAYLFEKYSLAQEVNALMVCYPAHKQSEVTEIKEILTQWIHKNLGPDPESRANKLPGLFWVGTMSDKFIDDALSKDTNHYKELSDSLIIKIMTERYGSAEWLSNWAEGKEFNNTFLVRNPSFTMFIRKDKNKQEIEIDENYVDKLEVLHQSVVENKNLGKHINNIENVWDSLLKLNDGGIGLLSDSLTSIKDIDTKLDRLQTALDNIQKDIKNRLGQWHTSSSKNDAEGQEKKINAIRESLQKSILSLGGKMLDMLGLDNEEVYKIYTGGAEEAERTGTENTDSESESMQTSPMKLNLGFGGLDLGGGSVGAKPNTSAVSSQEDKTLEALFAQNVYKAWLAHIDSLADNNSDFYKLGIDNADEVIPALIEEIKTASNYIDVSKASEKIKNGLKNINKDVEENRYVDLADLIRARVEDGKQVNARKEAIAGRYVFLAQMTIGDFLGYFGYLYKPKENRQQDQNGKPLFENKNLTISNAHYQMPNLGNDMRLSQYVYFVDWMQALIETIRSNAGRSAGSEISAADNAALGEILKGIGVLNEQ